MCNFVFILLTGYRADRLVAIRVCLGLELGIIQDDFTRGLLACQQQRLGGDFLCLRPSWSLFLATPLPRISLAKLKSLSHYPTNTSTAN